jgi:hypothetical protein
MNYDNLISLIKDFSERTIPAVENRHVYLWHGELRNLLNHIKDVNYDLLDLHKCVFDLPGLPYSQIEASKILRKIIQSKLAEILDKDKQQIIIIEGCDFLSRYKISIGPFFEYANESTLFVFVISPLETHFKPKNILPKFVSLNTENTYQYLKKIIGEKNTIEIQSGKKL